MKVQLEIWCSRLITLLEVMNIHLIKHEERLIKKHKLDTNDLLNINWQLSYFTLTLQC